jgi:hypothetical protein
MLSNARSVSNYKPLYIFLYRFYDVSRHMLYVIHIKNIIKTSKRLTII